MESAHGAVRAVRAAGRAVTRAVRRCGFAAAGLVAAGTPAPAQTHASEALALQVEARHLVNREGSVVPYLADSPWMLFARLSVADAQDYIRVRRAQGFTVLQVQLTAFRGMRNPGGVLPFAGADSSQNLAHPNPAWFAHTDSIIAIAAAEGMYLAIAPLWLGCCGEGWAGKTAEGRQLPLTAAGVAGARAFGAWLGARYRRWPHVLWILGGDNDPAGARDAVDALASALREAAPHQLITYHAASSHSSTDVWPAATSWLSVSMTYTYFRGFRGAWTSEQPEPYEVNHREYQRRPVRPFVLGESTYEGEHGRDGSATRVRRQAWTSFLSGAAGSAYGSRAWAFREGWRDDLRLPGAAHMRHLRSWLDVTRWWQLIPDTAGTLVVAAGSRPRSASAAVSAFAPSGELAVSYLPSAQPVTLDLRRWTSHRIRAEWLNPRTGARIAGGTVARRRRQPLQPPAAGDWVLQLRAEPASVAP